MKVRLPERLGRRMSIGPFERPQDFLRFLVFASAGALVALAMGLPWGLLVVLAGALLTLLHREEETLLSLLLRRITYHLSRLSGASPPHGRPTPAGWQDAGGRPWRFYERPPLPIYGRPPEELEESSLRLTRLLAGAGGEVLLVRLTEPWDIRPYLPPVGRSASPVPTAYAELLSAAARDRFRARLLLGIASPEGGERSLDDLLGQEGWRRLSGGELLGRWRRIFAWDPRSGVPLPGGGG